MVRVVINDVPVCKLAGVELNGRAQAQKIVAKAEAFSHKDATFTTLRAETTNPLIAAADTAFALHVPLEISPDAVFNIIMQGVSAHVSTNPAHFRGVFVAHQGKKKLQVRDDSLVPGSWDNKWEHSIAALGKQILEDMSGTSAKSAIGARFTTTTLAEATAHTAVFMDVVKSYYEYTVFTMCGIPWVELTGTKSDWSLLGHAIKGLLHDLGLAVWNAELQAILAHFERAFDGLNDQGFWDQLYNKNGPKGSGDVSRVSGWIAKLFLYVGKDAHMNPMIGAASTVPMRQAPRPGFEATPWLDQQLWGPAIPRSKATCTTAIPLADFPAGTTKTAFKWNYYGVDLDMDLISGLVGVTCTTAGALRPEVGWVVAQQA